MQLAGDLRYQATIDQESHELLEFSIARSRTREVRSSPENTGYKADTVMTKKPAKHACIDMTNGNAVVVKPNDEVTTSKPEAGQRERGVAFSRKMLHEGVQQKKIVVEFSRNWGSPCLFKEPDKP